MRKHTPGPWLIKANLSGVLIQQAPDNTLGEKKVICGISFNSARMAVEEINANFDLIAAAPDLLKAAKIGLACANYIVAEYGQFVPDKNDPIDEQAYILSNMKKDVEKIKAAIEKAENIGND